MGRTVVSPESNKGKRKVEAMCFKKQVSPNLIAVGIIGKRVLGHR
jgi:hypothetical protein